MSLYLHSEADQERMTLKMEASISIKTFVPTYQYIPCHTSRLEASFSYLSEVKSWDISICPRTGKLIWFRRISTFELRVLMLMTSPITRYLYKRYTVKLRLSVRMFDTRSYYWDYSRYFHILFGLLTLWHISRFYLKPRVSIFTILKKKCVAG